MQCIIIINFHIIISMTMVIQIQTNLQTSCANINNNCIAGN